MSFMSEAQMFSLAADDQGQNLGTVYSTSPDTLREFGAAYMRDPRTRGNITLRSPEGRAIATYDAWMEQWFETAEALD